MEQSGNRRNVTVDDLLALVDKATRAIEHLQKENTRLLQQVADYKIASDTAVAELAAQMKRIEALEQAGAVMQQDAQWYRWFRSKYSDSTFFSYIEREFLLAQQSAAKAADVNAASSAGEDVARAA